MSQVAPEHKHVIVSKRLVIVNSASSVVARFLNVTILLWMYQFLLSHISPEEFAVYPVVMAVMGFAPLFFSLFTGGISRYVVDAYAKGQIRRVSEIVSSMVPLLAGYSLVFLTLGLTFAWYVDDVLTIPTEMIEEARIMLSLLVISFVAQMVLLPLGVGFHVKQRFLMLNLVGVLRDVLRIVLLLVFLLGIGASVVWVVVATVIAEFAYLIVMVWWSRSLVPELKLDPKAFNWKTGRELTSFGFWTTVGRLGDIMYINAATIVLNKMGSALDVTSYHLGATLFRQMQGTISIALVPLQPTLTAMNSLQDYSRLGNTFLRGGRYALWTSLIAACPLAIYSEELVQLYVGERFISASHVILLFMIMFPFTQPTALLPMTAMATAKVKPFFLAAFIAQFIGLLLMIFLAGQQKMGATGVTFALAVITVGSQLMYFWPLSFRIAKVSGRRFLSETLVPGFTPAIVATCVWFVLQRLIVPSSWFVLALSCAVGALVYITILLVFCLNHDERHEINSGLSKMGFKKISFA